MPVEPIELRSRRPADALRKCRKPAWAMQPFDDRARLTEAEKKIPVLRSAEPIRRKAAVAHSVGDAAA